MHLLKNLLKLPIFQKEVPRPQNEVKALCNFYYELRNWDKLPKEMYKQAKYSYPRNMKEAKKVLQYWTLAEAKQELFRIKSESKLYDYDFRISTIIMQAKKKLK